MSRRREPPPIIPRGTLRAGEAMDRRVFVRTAGGILIATTGLGAACTDVLPPLTLAVKTEPSTSATSGTALATQPAVQLKDAIGANLAKRGVMVTASLASGTGTLANATAATDGSGMATFNGLTITGAAGNYRLAFSAAGFAPVQASADAAVAPATGTLALATQPSTSATTGTALATQPAVQLKNSSGTSNVAQAGVTVTASLASGSATLSSTTAVTDSSGLATFSGLTLTGSGSCLLQFSAPGYGTVQAGAATVLSGATGTLGLATQPSTSATSGTALATQPAVQLKNASGTSNVAQAGVTVTASLASGSATLSNATAVTDGTGLATFSGLALTGSGSCLLQFSATNYGSVQASAATTLASAAGKLALTTQPSNAATSGTALAQQPVVQLEDAGGNSVALAGVTVTASVVPGTPALTNATAVTNSSGLATFSGLTITGANGNYTFQFAASGYTSVQASADTVLSGSTFQTPDILNNASFEESDTPNHWDGFTNNSGGYPPKGSAVATLTLDTAQHFDGSQAVNYTWVVNPNANDDGAEMQLNFTSQDRLWIRFYMRLQSGWKLGIQKLITGKGTDYATILLDQDLCSTNDGYKFYHLCTGGVLGTTIYTASQLTPDTWHYFEIDFWQNGDTGFDGTHDLPSAAFWLDGVQKTHADGPDPALGGTVLYWKGNRLYPYYPNQNRGSSLKVAQTRWVTTHNSPHSDSGTLWLDRIAMSSLGRIGP